MSLIPMLPCFCPHSRWFCSPFPQGLPIASSESALLETKGSAAWWEGDWSLGVGVLLPCKSIDINFKLLDSFGDALWCAATSVISFSNSTCGATPVSFGERTLVTRYLWTRNLWGNSPRSVAPVAECHPPVFLSYYHYMGKQHLALPGFPVFFQTSSMLRRFRTWAVIPKLEKSYPNFHS